MERKVLIANEVEKVNATIEGLLRKSGDSKNEAERIKNYFDSANQNVRDAEGLARNSMFGKAAYVACQAATEYSLAGMPESAKDSNFKSAEYRATSINKEKLRVPNYRYSMSSLAQFMSEKEENFKLVEGMNFNAKWMVKTLQESKISPKELTSDMLDALEIGYASARGLIFYYMHETDFRIGISSPLTSNNFVEDAVQYLFYWKVAKEGPEAAQIAVDDFVEEMTRHYSQSVDALTIRRNKFNEIIKTTVKTLLRDNDLEIKEEDDKSGATSIVT